MARTCYDHLAGVAGVLLHDALMRAGYLVAPGPKAYKLTRAGEEWVSGLGLADVLAGSRSPMARPCLDWSERKPHLAGRLAAHLLDSFFRDGWIARIRDTRAVRITDRGLRQFERAYGLNLNGGHSEAL